MLFLVYGMRFPMELLSLFHLLLYGNSLLMLTRCCTWSFLMVTVPLLWTSTILYGPVRGLCIFGNMPGVVKSTRSPLLYSCGNLLEFSLVFDLLISFCLLCRILAQSATYSTGRNISLLKTNWAGEAPRVMWCVLRIAKAAELKNSSHGFWSSSSLFSSSKLRRTFPSTWCTRSIMPLLWGLC